MLLTLDLPDDVARRLERRASGADLETFAIRAIERALPRYSEEELALIAAEVEGDEALAAEMSAFDSCVADGLDQES